MFWCDSFCRDLNNVSGFVSSEQCNIPFCRAFTSWTTNKIETWNIQLSIESFGMSKKCQRKFSDQRRIIGFKRHPRCFVQPPNPKPKGFKSWLANSNLLKSTWYDANKWPLHTSTTPVQWLRSTTTNPSLLRKVDNLIRQSMWSVYIWDIYGM
jgi:hypothetical protein